MLTSAKQQLVPFCTREGPWRYLQEVNSTMARGAPKILAVGNEFVSEAEDFSSGFLVEPLSHLVQNRQGGHELKPFRKHWQEKSTRTHQFVMNSGPKGGWCYMGRYDGSSPVTMTTEDFRGLPKKTRHAVYRLTAMTAGKSPQDVPSMYAKGEIQAVKIEFRRVRFENKINQALFDAVGRRSGVSEYH